MESKKIDLSIVVPTRHEAENVPLLLDEIKKAFKDTDIFYEAIFVDDHSEDGTYESLKRNSARNDNINVYKKRGKAGKGFSILEGFGYAKGNYVAFIDADLQYPPSALPEMYRKAVSENAHAVVANRKTYKGPFLRVLGSRLNALIFGKLLLGLEYDIQSGEKVFSKEIIPHINTKLVTGWTVDIPLLDACAEMGYKIISHDIEFNDRKNGHSKVGFIKTAVSIATCALKTKLSRKGIFTIGSQSPDSMHGSGVVFKRQRFITHSTLPHHISALKAVSRWQKLFAFFVLGTVVVGFIKEPITTAIVIISILSTVYFLDVLFSLFVVLKSLHFPPEFSFEEDDINKISDDELPVYTILCPLYKEGKVIGQFIESMEGLNWPKDKLDIIILLEEDDLETKEALSTLEVPSNIRTIVAPHSFPKTKPKACNFGLGLAKGDYVVIYDAEDRPEPNQLKKAYLAFGKLGEKTACLQAKLSYYNPFHNLLTRLFTAEYSLWFDVVLPGLQSIETTIPLGGTSNHFRISVLKKLHGWDAFNVTEDCDLGVRLFREGFKTAIIDSITLEEANSDLINWIRQRSRWIKGYMQTYLVHMRNPINLVKTHGLHSLVFQLVIGLRISFMLINPLLWAMTIAYFAAYSYFGPTIEALYPPVVFYMAGFSLIAGNFMYIYNYMIGCAKRKQWSLIKFVYLIPFYWFLASISAFVAFYQLIFKPHYWEKTHHGFHLRKSPERKLIFSKPAFSGGVLVLSSIAANFANFIYNAYLGRQVDLSQFGTIALIGNIFTIASVFSSALGKTVAYKTAFLFGKDKVPGKEFYLHVRKITWLFSLITTLSWLAITPLLASFFNESDVTPFLLFTPYWMISFVGSVNSGFLGGAHRFAILGISLLVESLSKVLLAVFAVETGNTGLVYAIIPAAVLLSFLYEAVSVSKIHTNVVEKVTRNLFPLGFFTTAVATRISSVIFLNADVILAKHFLTPLDAGRYALLSLSGKIVYFIGNLFGQFIIPLVSKEEGGGKNSSKLFYKLLLGSFTLSFVGFVAVGVLGFLTVPILFGSNSTSIVSFLPGYALAMLVFSISSSIVSYHQVKRQYLFSILPLLFALLEVVLISFASSTITTFLQIIFAVAWMQFGAITLFHYLYPKLKVSLEKWVDSVMPVGLTKRPTEEKGLGILILNWRDTKHVWAGGAEVYLQELAKRWAEKGHTVTILCGNDRKCQNTEQIDGINIIRKGGFCTVYLWAFLYYILRLQKLVDVVIDSENGIPFFSPLYTRKPVTLLIHHVHRDIVLNELKLPKYLLPLAFIARHLESILMPLIYRKSKVVAVSQSTKSELEKLGLSHGVEVVTPGVDTNKFKTSKKNSNPSILYVGRVKHYKSLDTLIRAHELVLKEKPNAKLLIAGFGDAREHLEKLSSELQLNKSVDFLGKVTEPQKVALMGSAWVFAYPSRMEGWGISVMEASACGTAVVASNVPGLRDSVRNPSTGFLVEKGNVKEFAKAILEVIENESIRKKFEREGRKWACNFTWDKSADSFLSILERGSKRGGLNEN